VKRTLTLCLAALLLSGCAHATTGQIATVDISRLTANWPKFLNYQNQLASDTDAIQRSKGSARDKARQLDAVRQRFINMQNEVTRDVQAAAEQVANEQHYKLVVTREFVGYGGTDITADVEKVLKITEKSPAP